MSRVCVCVRLCVYVCVGWCMCEPLLCLNMKTYEWLLKGSVRGYSRESGGSRGTLSLL